MPALCSINQNRCSLTSALRGRVGVQEVKAHTESRKLPGSLQNVIKASYKTYRKLHKEIDEILEERGSTCFCVVFWM